MKPIKADIVGVEGMVTIREVEKSPDIKNASSEVITITFCTDKMDPEVWRYLYESATAGTFLHMTLHDK